MKCFFFLLIVVFEIIGVWVVWKLEMVLYEMVKNKVGNILSLVGCIFLKVLKVKFGILKLLVNKWKLIVVVLIIKMM